MRLACAEESLLDQPRIRSNGQFERRMEDTVESREFGKSEMADRIDRGDSLFFMRFTMRVFHYQEIL